MKIRKLNRGDCSKVEVSQEESRAELSPGNSICLKLAAQAVQGC